LKQAHDEMLKFSYRVSDIPGVGVTVDTMAFKDSSISNTLQQEFLGFVFSGRCSGMASAAADLPGDLPGDRSTTATGLVSVQ